MTPEAQRIAIAEACGWSKSIVSNFPTQMTIPKHLGGDGVIVRTIPDYLNDLNAMHEAENYLLGHALEHEYSQREQYSLNLLRLVAFHKRDGFTWGDECEADFYLVSHATAAQRAEAFLRTIGKWTDYK